MDKKKRSVYLVVAVAIASLAMVAFEIVKVIRTLG